MNFFDHFFPDSHLVNYETKNEITNKKSDIGKKWNNQYKFEVIGLDAQSTSHIHLSIHLEFTVGTCAATASDFHDAVSKKSERKKFTKAKNENIQQKKSAKKKKLVKMLKNKVNTGQNTRKKTPKRQTLQNELLDNDKREKIKKKCNSSKIHSTVLDTTVSVQPSACLPFRLDLAGTRAEHDNDGEEKVRE